MKNKKYWIIGIVLAIFIVTNPTRNDCASYCGTKPMQISRKWNFFVFSIYKFTNDYVSADGSVHGKEYIGLLGNFFNVTKSNPQTYTPADSVRTADSIKMLDSAKMALPDSTKDPLHILSK